MNNSWKFRHRERHLTRPWVMGIVNVTPDSFSDGGSFLEPQAAVDHALALLQQGADIIDIGGESTRPGAVPVTLKEELARVLPVVTKLRQQQPEGIISVDTMKAEVARQALEEGADIINDVSAGLFDLKMVEVIRDYQPGYIIMHMQGTPATMQVQPQYDDVVDETLHFLAVRLADLESQGLVRESLVIDPGIGFGKVLDHTIRQLNQYGEYGRLGRPICLGVSRKGFLGQITGRGRDERLIGSVAVACWAMMQYRTSIFRVHDVAATLDAVKLFEALHALEDGP